MIDPKDLAEAVIQKMKEEHHIFWVDPEVHSAQHDFIKLLIEEREEQKARNQRIKEKVAGSLVLSGILGILGLVGAGVLNWIELHLK